MSNEVNLTKDEVMPDDIVISDVKKNDASDGNKIVPIANVVADTATSNSVTDNVTVTASDSPVTADSAALADSSADSSAITGSVGSVDSANSSDAAGFASTDNNPSPEISASDGTARKTASSDRRTAQAEPVKAYYDEEPDEDFHFADEERPRRPFFRFRSGDEEESRDKLILSRIKDEDLMEYLALEQRRLEFLQQAKETKQKRLLTAFQLLISLAAIVAVTYLLKDNPTILISILYIVGIIAALNIWKNPHDKGKGRK